MHTNHHRTPAQQTRTGLVFAREQRVLWLITQWYRAQLTIHTRDTTPVELTVNGLSMPPVGIRALPALLTVLGLPPLQEWEDGPLSPPYAHLSIVLCALYLHGARHLILTGPHPRVGLSLHEEPPRDTQMFCLDISANAATVTELPIDQAVAILLALGLGHETCWHHQARK